MISKKLTLNNIPSFIKNKRIFFRADFNVPLSDGKVANTKRITSALPSIRFLLQNGAQSITLASHLGRPKGQYKPEFSLQPVAECLRDLLSRDVNFLRIDDQASIDQVRSSNQKGKIFLLQNLRFNAAQQGVGVKNQVKFKASDDEVKQFRSFLSSFGQIYVNDAFGTSHRAHSSMVGVCKNGLRAAGLLVDKEIEYFSKVIKSPVRPLVVFMGGKKVHDKLPLLKNMIKMADQIVIGGAIAFTFLKVHKNMSIGSSLFDQQGAKLVPQIMELARKNNVKIHLPQDIASGNQFTANSQVKLSDIEQGVPDGWMGLDVGEKTLQSTKEVINRAKTLFWNGPYGAFQLQQFAKGSRGLLKSVIDATSNNSLTSVAGGGDTINMCKLIDGGMQKISHVSTGGGAFLQLMEGKVLPGIDALSDLDDAMQKIQDLKNSETKQ